MEYDDEFSESSSNLGPMVSPPYKSIFDLSSSNSNNETKIKPVTIGSAKQRALSVNKETMQQVGYTDDGVSAEKGTAARKPRTRRNPKSRESGEAPEPPRKRPAAASSSRKRKPKVANQVLGLTDILGEVAVNTMNGGDPGPSNVSDDNRSAANTTPLGTAETTHPEVVASASAPPPKQKKARKRAAPKPKAEAAATSAASNEEAAGAAKPKRQRKRKAPVLLNNSGEPAAAVAAEKEIDQRQADIQKIVAKNFNLASLDGTDHTNRVYLKLNESIKIDGDVVRTMLRIFVKKNVVYWCPLYEIVSLNKIFREIYYNDKLEISMGYTAVGFCPVVVFKSQSLKIIEKGTILVKIINLEEIFELKRDKKTPAVESEPSSV